MLLHFGITPFLVFDGDYLPSKARTEKERAARRTESKKSGLELLRLGKAPQAQLELQKAVDVTPEMAGLLIEELKRANLPYVVAPYEADSQLAYLEKKGIIHAVLSEDSDLLVFGVRVLLTKLDQYGECVMIRRDDFTACREVSLVGWSDAEFRKMAILSGCDYLASIDKMGLKTAYRMIRKHKTIERTVRSLQFDGKFKVPSGYLDDFARAEMTFLYQWVYCPEAKSLVNFCGPPGDVDVHTMQYIGRFVESSVAQGVATGALNPHSKKPLILPSLPRPARFQTLSSALKKENMTPPATDTKIKKIEAFFKPKTRIPLAELDPNLFTPSPTQQETLRRASGASWPATPTPILQTSTPAQSTMSVPARRAASDSWIRTASGRVEAARSVTETSRIRSAMGGRPSGFELSSDFQSTKRARLCLEGSSPVKAGTTRVETGRSKFFASPAKKRKTSANNLWSDDSLDDALCDLPYPDTFASPVRRKKGAIQIFDEREAVAEPSAPDEEDTSQNTVFTVGSSVQSQELRQVATPASSVESGIEETKPVPGRRGLAARLTYGSDQKTGPKVKCFDEPGLEDEEEVVVPGSDPIAPPANELPSHIDVVSGGDNTDRGRVLIETEENLPLSNMAMKGSEDFLVSASEDEGIASPRPAKTPFNVSRFAFLPR
jgi:exonuclease 1